MFFHACSRSFFNKMLNPHWWKQAHSMTLPPAALHSKCYIIEVWERLDLLCGYCFDFFLSRPLQILSHTYNLRTMMLFGKRFTMMLFGYFSNIQFHIKFLQNHIKLLLACFAMWYVYWVVLKACSVISKTRGGKSTKILYSSKSTITLLKFYLSTSKSTSLKIYSSKSKK